MQHPYQSLQYYDAQVFVWSPGSGESVRRGVKVGQHRHLSVEEKLPLLSFHQRF